MRILVTGGMGLIGSHFVRKLSSRHNVKSIDISNNEDACEFFLENNSHFDLVLHCAAIVGGRKTIESQPYRLFNNLNLDAGLFGWAMRTKPSKIVYFSSSAAYPMNLQFDNSGINMQEGDIDLDNVASPDPSIYGWSKLTGEQLIRYAKNEGLNIWTFRPFSGYSEEQSLDYPFPSFIDRAKRKMNPFEIWGDGNQVRDWVHIDDIIEMVLTALEYDPDVYNICTGRPMSFNEFAEIATKMAGYKAQFKHRLEAPVGVRYRVGDPTKMNKVYTAKITLEEGISRALEA